MREISEAERVKRRERARIYRLLNKDRLRDLRAKNRLKYKGYYTDYQKEYREKNREKLHEYNTRYREENRDQLMIKRRARTMEERAEIARMGLRAYEDKLLREEEERDLEEIRTQTIKNPFEGCDKPKRQLRGI